MHKISGVPAIPHIMYRKVVNFRGQKIFLNTECRNVFYVYNSYMKHGNDAVWQYSARGGVEIAIQNLAASRSVRSIETLT